MRRYGPRASRNDQGSIILALLGIVILTTVASVGLVAVVNGQNQTRHDNRFAQALNNAESGVDAMVAKIKATDALNSPTQALLQTPTLNQAGVYSVTAKPANTVDETGAAAYTTWIITSIGKAKVAGLTITRVVQQTVKITHSYTTPIDGTNQLSLPSGSKVTTYTRGDGDATCGETVVVDGVSETETSCQQDKIADGITLPLGLGTLGSTTITNVPSGGSPGPAQTGGTLDVASTDLSNFSQIQLDGPGTNGDPPGGSCAATNTGPCSTSTVVTDTDPPPTIQAPGCASYTGSGAALGINGQPLVNLAWIPTFGLVFNHNLMLNTYSSPPVSDVYCTNLPVVLPTIGTNLNALGLDGLTNLTGLQAAVDMPIGADCGAQNLQAVLTLSLTCTMNDPSKLVINELGTCAQASPCGSTVYVGTGTGCQVPPQSGCTPIPTYISALIAAPNGTCNINGNVVLYGALNCKYITYTAGSSLTVYYPTDDKLGFDNTKHKDSVSDWNECDANFNSCPLPTS
jgi:hypothetical protein